jgi:hypothetical protein
VEFSHLSVDIQIGGRVEPVVLMVVMGLVLLDRLFTVYELLVLLEDNPDIHLAHFMEAVQGGFLVTVLMLFLALPHLVLHALPILVLEVGLVIPIVEMAVLGVALWSGSHE